MFIDILGKNSRKAGEVKNPHDTKRKKKKKKKREHEKAHV